MMGEIGSVMSSRKAGGTKDLLPAGSTPMSCSNGWNGVPLSKGILKSAIPVMSERKKSDADQEAAAHDSTHP